MASKRYTHRVIRGFPLDGVTLERGQLVSSDDWTWQGKIYVEARGWVEKLEPKVVAHYAALAEQEAAEIAKAVVEKTEEIVQDVVEAISPKPTVKKAQGKTLEAAEKTTPVKKSGPAKKSTTAKKKTSPTKIAPKKTSEK